MRDQVALTRLAAYCRPEFYCLVFPDRSLSQRRVDRPSPFTRNYYIPVCLGLLHARKLIRSSHDRWPAQR